MQTDVVSDSTGLAALREDWEELERRDDRASYYSTHRFVSAWWYAHEDSPGIDLHVVVVRNNGEVVGIAPLAVRTLEQDGVSRRLVVAAGHGDYLTTLVHPQANADTVGKAIVQAIDDPERFTRIRVTSLPQDSHLVRTLLKSPHNGEVKHYIENPRIDLTPYADLADFERRVGLPSHTRKYRNKMLRERDVTFRVFRGDEDDVFERLAAVHVAEKQYLTNERSRPDRRSLFEDPRRRAHLQRVFTETDDCVTFGYVDGAGELVGYRTCFRHGRTLLSWNSAYHPDYDVYRIGKVIQYDILDHLFQEGTVDVFDFGAGRYPWKFEWTGAFSSTYIWRRELQEAAPRKAPTPRRASSPATGTRGERPATRETTGRRGAAPVPPPEPSLAAKLLGTEVRRVLRPLARSVRSAARGGRNAVRRRTQPPVVWYVPHPDDETLWMGGSLHRIQDRRNVVVVLTGGGASKAIAKVGEKLGRPLDVAAFTAARRREMAAALPHLGVNPRSVIQLDLVDGALRADDVYDVVVRMARAHPGAQHRTLSYLDPHADHAAAGEALRRAHRENVVQDSVFHLPIPLMSDDLGERAPLSRADADAKRAALREYQVWDAAAGRYAIGGSSVKKLFRAQLDTPVERVHGPDYDA